LRLWQDDYGLATEMDVPATLAGTGLRDLVARGMNAMSFGLINLRSLYFRDEEGVLCRDISRCDLEHVSIVDRGAFPSACCWLSETPTDFMSPKIAAASRHWFLGRIHRDQRRASNAAMLARYRAEKAAPARRRPAWRATPVAIPGLAEAAEAARRVGRMD